MAWVIGGALWMIVVAWVVRAATWIDWRDAFAQRAWRRRHRARMHPSPRLGREASERLYRTVVERDV